MTKKSIRIFGSSHLAFRLTKQLLLEDKIVSHCSMEALHKLSEAGTFIENLEIYIATNPLENIERIFVLDDIDEHNLQLIIALSVIQNNVPVVASLFNENLIPHLQKSNKNLTILNRAKIASPVFVDAVYTQLVRKELPVTNDALKKTKEKFSLSLVKKLIIFLTLFLSSAVIFFCHFEDLSIINSIYFVVATATSTGFGDINLLNSSDLSKLVGILLMLGSTILIWLIFSFVIDFYFKQRILIALGRKKYNLKNHVVLCGLGKVGYFVVENLIAKNEKVIIVEINENSKHIDHFRNLGAEVYIGDARNIQVMQDVNIAQAKALISVIDNDALNLEIGLNARSINNNLRLILRIFDEEMTIHIRKILNIELTFSASTIALTKFMETLKT
jgi:hypothetical protein